MKPGSSAIRRLWADNGVNSPLALAHREWTMSNTLRVYWRPIFCACVVVGSAMITLFMRDTVYQTGAFRSTLVGMWLALALLYGLLAVAAPQRSNGWRAIDVLSVVVLLFAAWYEAHWPGPWVNHTPESVTMPWAGACGGSLFHEARRVARQAKAAARGG